LIKIFFCDILVKVTVTIKLGGNTMKVDRETCIGCGACVGTCPVNAISIVDDKASIDPEICISCGACADMCPVNAISE